MTMIICDEEYDRLIRADNELFKIRAELNALLNTVEVYGDRLAFETEEYDNHWSNLRSLMGRKNKAAERI